MTVTITKHQPATIQCVSAFTKWYGMPVCEDMDINTEVAWDHWQHAWHAAKRDSDREQAENVTLQAAWRIADEASRELIEVHGMRVDHVTISFDADEIASTPALEEAIEYLENRGLATRMDTPDEVLVIMNWDDYSGGLMAGHRIEEEYKGFRMVVHRIGSSGDFSAYAIRPPTGTKRLFAGEFSGEGSKKAAYEKIKEMVDAAVMAERDPRSDAAEIGRQMP